MRGPVARIDDHMQSAERLDGLWPIAVVGPPRITGEDFAFALMHAGTYQSLLQPQCAGETLDLIGQGFDPPLETLH